MCFFNRWALQGPLDFNRYFIQLRSIFLKMMVMMLVMMVMVLMMMTMIVLTHHWWVISDAEVRPPLTAYPDGREKLSEYILCRYVLQWFSNTDGMPFLSNQHFSSYYKDSLSPTAGDSPQCCFDPILVICCDLWSPFWPKRAAHQTQRQGPHQRPAVTNECRDGKSD